MTVTCQERIALVALLRQAHRPWPEYAQLVERAGDAMSVLERELGADGNQTTLLPVRPGPLLEHAATDLARWAADGVQLLSVLDDAYPANLREVHDRPPLVFVAGHLHPRDDRSIAVIGARRAGPDSLELAARFASEFVEAGYVVVSGLAAGIDAAAHEATLQREGRTLGVIGTGLQHSYPPENAGLQRRIAERGAVISQFWPDSPPSRVSFPMRNAVMSGLSRGSVVIEASESSGATTQARLALGHGRPVFLLSRLLSQPWARELSSRAGVHVVDGPTQVVDVLERSPWPA